MLATDCPRKLNAAVAVLLDALVEVFDESGFKINWAKGKTEAMVKYRGRHSAEATECLKRPDGSIGYELPVKAGSSILH
eukprot:4681933-Karenia_brevis.AAC.1